MTRLGSMGQLAFVVLLLPAGGAEKGESGFLNRKITVSGTEYLYQVYVPEQWSADSQWPVILFLHGAGERGDDGLLQTQVGIATAIRLYKRRFPAIVVMPQCRKNMWWTQDEMETQAMEALAQAMREFNGDPQRVYLTGLSMGGYGTWSLATKNPGMFAALAPVCGGVRLPPRLAALQPQPPSGPDVDPYRAAAQKIGKTPVWIFHGGADPVVPVSESRSMAEALKAAGGDVRFTEYEGVGHNSWDRAYAEAEFTSWLLAQRNTGARSPR